MITLFLQIFRLVNIAYTALFGALMFYWITVALGLLDIDVLDFDVEDMESGLGGLLGILNIGEVPFSIWLTIFSFEMWVYSILYNLLLDAIFPSLGGGLRFISCAILFMPLAAVVTRITTKPMKKLFEIRSVKRSDFVGKECRVTSPEVNERSGVGEINISGVPNIIYIRAKSEEQLKKNDSVLIYEYDEAKDLFYVSRV